MGDGLVEILKMGLFVVCTLAVFCVVLLIVAIVT